MAKIGFTMANSISFDIIPIGDTLWTWGGNSSGQLGNNTLTNRSSPVQTIAGGTNWKQVSNSNANTAAIKTDGTLWNWGENAYFQLGNSYYWLASSKNPLLLMTSSLGSSLNLHNNLSTKIGTALIKTDGTLWNWGSNSWGQLGDNTIVHKSSPVQTITGGTNWKQVAGGIYNTAAVKTDGTLWIWGDNSWGQLGDNTIVAKSSPIQTIAGGTNWSQVACGPWNIAAIKTDGTLWTWGLNSAGELGDNTAVAKSSPIQTIAGGTNWSQVACGDRHIAAIKTDGTLWLWGTNSFYGFLGDSTIVGKSSPVQTITGGTDWKQVACGTGITAAIKTDGTLWNWGNNISGQLGNSTQVAKSSPIQTIAGGTNWSQVNCGDSFTAAIKTDGTLWTWGGNSSGQLGNNTLTNRSSPVQTIAGGTNWNYISTSSNSMYSIDTSDNLWSWGSNTAGQLFIAGSADNKSSPVQTIAGGTNWSQVETSLDHTAAIKTDGTLWTWGYNTQGQLGDNTQVAKSSPIQTIAGGTNWSQVACGTTYTAAIKTDGTLWTWGYNGYGNLGDNTAVKKSSPIQTIAGGTNWSQVACGIYNTAAIKTDGTLWTWGYNSSGQLGDNTQVSKYSPAQTIAGGTNWKYVSCGDSHIIAIQLNNTLWTWGSNTNGNLGDNTQVAKSSPIQTIAGGTSWKQVSGGTTYTAAIKTDGTLWTWGYNFTGVLGDNTRSYKSSPVQTIAGGTNWKQVGGGVGSVHISAIISTTSPILGNIQDGDSSDLGDLLVPRDIFSEGGLWVWGSNAHGNLGDNTQVAKSSPIQTIAGGTNWKQVSSLYRHTAAIKTDGTLWIWGVNSRGQLGDNTNSFSISFRLSPIQTIAGGTNWKQVACGYTNNAAVKTDGTLWIWGDNSSGQLGDNTQVPKSSPVQTIAGGTNWKQVSIGGEHTAAIKTDGTLWTWGDNTYNALGDNTSAGNWKSSPVQTIAGGTNWKQVSCSTSTTAAIKTDGTLWAWGWNYYGDVGDNTQISRGSPVQTIAGGTNWKYVYTGNETTSAIKTDGTLWTWGWNTQGQLGNSTTVWKSSPVQTIAGGTNWKQVACGYKSIAAIKTDGTLWNWGDNTQGQLGDSTITSNSSPVQTIAGGTNWKQVACGSDHTIALKDDM